MAIKLIRLFTGDDGQSHFSLGEIAWRIEAGVNALSGSEPAQSISFEETAAGSSLDWHNAPHRQYVITLSGRLEFETRKGEKHLRQQTENWNRLSFAIATVLKARAEEI